MYQQFLRWIPQNDFWPLWFPPLRKVGYRVSWLFSRFWKAVSPFLKDVGNRGKPVEGMRSNTSTRIGLNSPKHETKSSIQYFCKGHGRSFHRSTTRWNGQALNSFPKQDGWFAKRIRPTNPNHSQICGPWKILSRAKWVLSTPLDDIRNLINTANFADSGFSNLLLPKNTNGR